MLARTYKSILFALGFISLAVGIIGIFLPILPTVPFLLITAFCFSKSSPRWHAWLLSKPYVGPMILDWQKHGVIETRAKILATVMLWALLTYPLLIAPVATHWRISILLVAVAVSAFIWTRPSIRRKRPIKDS